MTLTIQWMWTGKQKCWSDVDPRIKLSSSLNLLSEKWEDCMSIGQTMCIFSYNQDLSEWNSRAFGVIFLVIQFHELGLWTLELNSALTPDSVIHSLCSMEKLFNLLEPLFPHLYIRIIIVFVSEGQNKGLDIEIIHWKSLAHSAGHTACGLW